MIPALAAVLLATPAFTKVHDCGGLPPLKWESWLYRDDDALFHQEAFLSETEWHGGADDVTGNGVIHDCFGVGNPHSRDVVVHHYPAAPFTPYRVRPVLLIGGAGDNSLRSMSFLAVSLSHQGFDSWSLTFAHPHGDNFEQAEQVANVIGLMRAAHPGVKVDVLAYSKGGMAARIYASNGADADWGSGHADYARRGTRYRGDVGRLILVGSPNAGVDTAFRWTDPNLFPVTGHPLNAPGSWTRYYPQTTANLLAEVDLSPYSLFREGGDHFPGQAQMLADLSTLHAIPGGNARLGAYGVQPDYLTTYEGGLGFTSFSPGLHAAIDEGGRTIERLQALGIDPDIDLTVVAGGNPIIGTGALGEAYFEAGWGDLDAAQRRTAWEQLVGDWLGDQVGWVEVFRYDLPRLFAGTAFLGEISGPSDGLVFTDSALDTSGLTKRGAHLHAHKLFQGLNHAELVAAGTLAATFYGDSELAGGLYDPALAQKYGDPENQAVEWYMNVLGEAVPDMPPPGPDAGPLAADAGVPPDAELPPPIPVDAAIAEAAPADAGGDLAPPLDAAPPAADAAPTAHPHHEHGGFFGGSCQQAPAGPALLPLALAALFRRRRGRSS
jgi:hypothetical protein